MTRNNEDRLRTVKDTNPPPQTTQETVFTFSTPTEFVELPSRGEFYDPEHPLHGQTTVEIKYMTAKEEDILTSKALLKKGIAIDRLLESVLVDKSLNVDSLLVGDKNALLVATRITGYGSDYSTNVTCPGCNATSVHTFELDKLETTSTPFSPEAPPRTSNNTFLIEGLPRTGATVEVKLLYGSDEKRITTQLATKKKHSLGGSALFEQMKAFIVSVNGNSEHLFVESFLQNLPAMDARHLRQSYTALVPNIDLTQQFDCVECDFSTVMEVPLTADFFWPR